MKATLKHFAAAAVLATSSFGAFAAAAPSVNEFDLGAIEIDGGALFGNKWTTSAGAFIDKFSFSIPTWSDAGGSVTSSKVTVRGKTQDVDITDFYLTSAAGRIGGDQISGGALEWWTFETMGMAPGAYVLHVVGNVVGNAGGSYAGQFGTLSVVPEASTLAMMLAGMGIVGAVARRRKAGDTAAQPAATAVAAA